MYIIIHYHNELELYIKKQLENHVSNHSEDNILTNDNFAIQLGKKYLFAYTKSFHTNGMIKHLLYYYDILKV